MGRGNPSRRRGVIPVNNAVDVWGGERVVGPGWHAHPEPFDVTHRAVYSADELRPVVVVARRERAKLRWHSWEFDVRRMSKISTQNVCYVWISEELRARIRVKDLTSVAVTACVIQEGQRAKKAVEGLLKPWRVPEGVSAIIYAFVEWWQWGHTASSDTTCNPCVKACALGVGSDVQTSNRSGLVPLFLAATSARQFEMQMRPTDSAQKRAEYYAWLAMRDWVLSATWTGAQSAECYDAFGYGRHVLVHRVGPSCIAATVICPIACPVDVARRYEAAELQPIQARQVRTDERIRDYDQLDRTYFNGADRIAERKAALWADATPVVVPQTMTIVAAYWADYRTPERAWEGCRVSKRTKCLAEPSHVARHAEILLPAPSSYTNIAVWMRVQGEGFQCATRVDHNQRVSR